MADPAAICDRVLELVGGRAEAIAVVSTGRSALTRFANSFIHQNVADDDTSLLLRVVVEGRLAATSTTQIDDGGLARTVEAALEAARLRPVDPGWPGLAPPAPAPPDTTHYDDATAVAAPDDRAEVVRAFVDAGGDLAAAGYCSTDGATVALANSAGQRLVGRYTAAALEGIQQLVSARGAGLATQASSRFADLDGTASGSRAATTARRSADPIDIEPGEYEVVLEAEAVATVVDFLASYGFNGKSFNEGESFVRLGDAQFDAAVSLADHATDPRAIGLTFDVEGTPKRRVDLVLAGVSTALIHDRRSAKESGGGARSTGHAVPGSDTWGPYPANVFLAGQDRSTDDLVASVDRGLLVTELNYCRVLDPKTMVVTGLTRNGTFLIEGGRVAKPVSNLRFTQSFAGALAPGQVLGLGAARFAQSNEGATLHVPGLHLATWNVTGGVRG